MRFKDFSAITLDDIPNGFINFNKLNIKIDKQQMKEDKPLYLSVDDGVSRGKYSNVCVDQEGDDGAIKHIAYFYKKYGYSKAFEIMLNTEENLKYYRLFISGKNKENNKIHMRVDFYIEATYLLNLYEISEIPPIIYKLIIDASIKNDELYKPTINNCTNIQNTATQLQVKRQPFSYQLANINWMVNLETSVDNDTLAYETFIKPDNVVYYEIKSIDELLLLDSGNGKMVDPKTLETHLFNFRGGILADDIGLGKTYTTIGLIKQTYNSESRPTLVVCPKRLSKQWQTEIENTCDLKSYIVNTLPQFKKLNNNNIDNYSIIITSYEFLTNVRYASHIEEPLNREKFNINNYCWERIILDEGHEYVTSGQNINKIQPRNTLRILNQLHSKYRWICSGTPFNNRLDLWELIHYLRKDNTNTQRYSGKYIINSENYHTNKRYQHAINGIMELVVRKNTKESVEEEVNIPEYDMTTTLLHMTTIERAIYNSALDDDSKKQELCNHVLVSENHINILGNSPISMEDTHAKMMAYYGKKIKYQSKRIINIETQLKELDINNDADVIVEFEAKKQEISDELRDNIRKKQLFDELEEKLKEEKTCPICFEDFDGLYKAVTPCGHFICGDCIQHISHHNVRLECPLCRSPFEKTKLEIISPETTDKTTRLGTKMSALIETADRIINADPNNRIIILSQWDSMLKLISTNLKSNLVNHLILNGSYHTVNSKIRKFKLDSSVRILMLSSEKAASGLTLTEATHIILMDTMNRDLETSRTIETQAIGRAVRIGQTKRVQVIRLIMKDSIEEEYYNKFISV